MHRFPALRARGVCYRLPWTSDDVRRASSALLSADLAERIGLWSDLLDDCPTLALWAVCRNSQWRSAPPASWTAVATWLAETPAELWWSALSIGDDRGASEKAEDGELSDASGTDSATTEDDWRVDHGADRRPQWLLLWDQFCQSRRGARKSRLAARPSANDPWLALGAAWLVASESRGRDRAVEAAPDWLMQGWRLGGRASGLDALRGLRDARRPSAWRVPCDPWLARDREPGLASLTRLVERVVAGRDWQARLQDQLRDEKLRALKELAYGASHELNNPLANIAARAESLLWDETDPQRRRKLESIHRQAFRAHEMIADMMLFAKPPRMQASLCPLRSLVDEAIRAMQSAATLQQTSVQLEWRLAEDATLTCDPRYVGEALRALMRNALESVGAGGWLQVGVGETDSGEAIVISVADNGPGLSESARRHLFDPYYSGREAGRGLGLGLCKTWRIVTELGGRIEVQSEPQRGAVFQMHFPRKRPTGASAA